jgi:hypothetical protein
MLYIVAYITGESLLLLLLFCDPLLVCYNFPLPQLNRQASKVASASLFSFVSDTSPLSKNEPSSLFPSFTPIALERHILRLCFDVHRHAVMDRCPRSNLVCLAPSTTPDQPHTLTTSPILHICPKEAFQAQVSFFGSHPPAKDLIFITPTVLLFNPSIILPRPNPSSPSHGQNVLHRSILLHPLHTPERSLLDMHRPRPRPPAAPVRPAQLPPPLPCLLQAQGRQNTRRTGGSRGDSSGMRVFDNGLENLPTASRPTAATPSSTRALLVRMEGSGTMARPIRQPVSAPPNLTAARTGVANTTRTSFLALAAAGQPEPRGPQALRATERRAHLMADLARSSDLTSEDRASLFSGMAWNPATDALLENAAMPTRQLAAARADLRSLFDEGVAAAAENQSTCTGRSGERP